MMFFKVNKSTKENRPLLKPEWVPLDWIIEVFAILGLLTLYGTGIFFFPKLPEIIPTHFNGSGQPDGFGSKFYFWILPGLGLFVYALLTLINLIPHQFNYLVKITPENALKQYTMGTRFIRYLKMVIIWMFFYINLSIIQSINQEPARLGLWFMPVFMAFIFIPMIVYFILSYKKS
jgi:uncharacterized membrane protein